MLKEVQTAVDGTDLLEIIDIEDIGDDIESIEKDHIANMINQNLSIRGIN